MRGGWAHSECSWRAVFTSTLAMAAAVVLIQFIPRAGEAEDQGENRIDGLGWVLAVGPLSRSEVGVWSDPNLRAGLGFQKTPRVICLRYSLGVLSPPLHPPSFSSLHSPHHGSEFLLSSPGAAENPNGAFALVSVRRKFFLAGANL